MSRDEPSVVARLRSAPGDDLAAAVVTPGGACTRREFLDRVEAGAAVLVDELGSALIGVCLPDGAELATAVLAAMGAGGAAPVRADLPADAIAAHFTRTRVAAVVAAVDSPAATVAHDLGLTVVRPHGDDVFHLRRPDRPPAHRPQTDIADLALVLTTSGTTGEPKVVPLRHGNLLASIDRIVASLGLSPDDRSLLVMPLTHIHGVVAGFLAPLAAGGTVFLGGRFDPVTFPDAAASFGATLVTAVPTIHRTLAETPADQAWSERLRLVRSSSSALPASVADSLERRFGVPVLEAYGMTEAAHQITSNTVDDPRRGTVGRADGARVRVTDREGRTLEPDRVGDVVIRGQNVMGGYTGDAAVNDAAFVDGWFRTGDLGRIDSDGHLVLVGRTKEMINRGGETIAPGPIEEVLRGVAGVRDAVVYAAPHPTLGEQVAAVVVAENGSVPVLRLQREVGRRLGDTEVPRLVHGVDEIPLGPTGKVQRNLLADLFDGAAPPSSKEPQGLAESEVADAWRAVGLSPTAPSDDFIALGGDSLTALTVAFDLGQRWGFEVRPVDLLRDTSLSGMAALRSRSPRARAQPEAVDVAGPTTAQRRMLAADRLGLEAGASHMAFAWMIHGDLDPGRLRAAVEAVIARHPALREAFVFAPVLGYVPLPIDRAHAWIDDAGVADADQAGAAFERLAARRYDLVGGPLARFALWSLGATDRWFFGFAYHHSVLDGRSRRVVLDELASAFVGEVPGPPVPRAVAYHRPLGETDQAWWRDRFRGVPLELPWASRRGARAGDSDLGPAVERIDLADSTMAALHRLCTAHHLTPTMVLVAATAVGLNRLTGEDKVAVGLAVDHRRPGRDEATGVTMDSAPVVVDVPASGSIAELLAAVRRECLEVYERSDCGLEEIRLAAGRAFGEPILHARAQVRTDADHLELGDLAVDSLAIDPMVARTPVSLDLRIGGDRPGLEIVFDSRLVEGGVTASYARSFSSIIASLVEAPDRRLEELGSVSTADLALIDEWGQGSPGAPAFSTVDAWFRSCVARWPRRTAVRSFDHEMTFVELDRMVQRVASAVVARTPVGARIASVLPGGLEQVVLQLAAWRIGRVVIAVDADGSQRRTASQLASASPALVVTVAGESAPSGHEWVSFDDLLTASVHVLEPPSIDPDAPAWGCLTSGTTGVPDLIIGTQSNLVHLVHAWHEAIPPDAVGIATVSKPAVAVGFVSEWMAPLLAGSTLFFLNGVTARDPFRTALRLKELAVTWYRGTPAMLHSVARQVLAHDGPNRHVALVVSGADRLSRPTADAVAEAFPSATIINQYGCTEATSESTLGPVRVGRGDPDIGRPLANVCVEVIDRHGCRVPPGVRGEIVIDGPLVTPSGSGDRGHRSGDLGWWDGDGRLHFVGRGDSRLSVNGNRIEAGEVETALVSTGLVESALVMPDAETGRGDSLAALVTPRGHHSTVDIRAAAADLLPSYAVPNRIEIVDAFPLLASGKIDQLQAQAILGRAGAAVDLEPLPSHVADICAVVAAVLGRSPATIDPTRSLQANGGDSFAAISLQEQLHAIRGVRLDIAALVNDRPLAELAVDGSSSLGEPLPGRLRRLAFGIDARRVIWFPGGGGLDVEVRRLVHHLSAPPEILVYPYPGAEIGERPTLVLRRLVARIVETLEELDGPPPIVAGNSFGGLVAVEVVRRLDRRRPGSVAGLLIVDALPIEQRRRARGGRLGERARADLRGLLTDRGRDDSDPAARWRRNFRASRLMLDTHRRSGTVSGVPAVVVATAERRRSTGRADLGWSQHLGDTVTAIDLPGDHGGLLVEPKVTATARAVAQALQLFAPADR